MLQSGPVPARTEPLHSSQSGQQEGQNRVYGEEAGGKIIINVFCTLPLHPVDGVIVWLIEEYIWVYSGSKIWSINQGFGEIIWVPYLF